MAPKKKKGGGPAVPAGDDQNVLDQIERQKMIVEMEHLNNRMKSLMKDQEKMTTEKGELNTKMDLEMKKHEHIYKYLQHQISEKDDEIEALKRQLKLSAADKAAQAEELLRQIDQEKNDGSERVSGLNKQIRELYEKTERVDAFDKVMAEQNKLAEELAATQKRLAETQEELDAWQRQTMILTQPLHRDTIVLTLLEAMRLYPMLEVLQVESLAALQNVVSPENPSEILDNSAMIREFGGIGIILASMRDHLTNERIQCNACGFLWKLSFWDSENIPVILANGGMHLILAAMTAHPNYAKLQYSACGALRALMGPARSSNDRNTRSPSPFMRAPSIEPPPPAPTRTRTPPGGSRFPQIGSPGQRTQKDLAPRPKSPPRDPDKVSSEEMATAWTKMHSHAMQLLLKCMADHHNHELIQTYSIGALMNIVNSSDSILVPAGRSGVIAAVMDAMRTHQENAELQMVGLRTMTRLAHSKQNRKVVEKSGGKELTRRAIEVHKGNPMVEEAANEMKKYLKTWDDDSDDDTAN